MIHTNDICNYIYDDGNIENFIVIMYLYFILCLFIRSISNYNQIHKMDVNSGWISKTPLEVNESFIFTEYVYTDSFQIFHTK